MLEPTSWNSLSSYVVVSVVCCCMGISVVCNLLLGLYITFCHSESKNGPGQGQK